MKKAFFGLLVLLLLTGAALAEPGFVLDENVVITDMERTWRQGYEPTVSDGTVSICLPLTAENSNGKLTATLVMEDETISPFKKQNMSVTVWREDGLFSVRLRLKLLSDYENGDYACCVRVEGKDSSGNEISAEYPLVLRLRGGRPSSEALRPGLVSLFGELNVGESGELTARLINPCSYAEFTDILLTVADESGEILPQGSDVLQLGDLKPGESRMIKIPLTVLPDAAVSLHTLKFDFTYTALGEKLTWTERFSWPVSQEIRLEQGGLQLASTVVQGDMASLTLPLMNMGRADVCNTIATLSIPGVVEGQSVLVGTIVPGETKNAKLTFVPGKGVLGDIEGVLTVTCEDEWSNATSFSLPVAITVEEPLPQASTLAETTAKAQAKEPEWLVTALIGGCALLAAALVLQGLLLRRKIHQLEEERL